MKKFFGLLLSSFALLSLISCGKRTCTVIWQNYDETVGYELDGFLLVRCVEGTTQPSWDKHGDDYSSDRVFNQTNNIDCTSGVYSYACTNWVDYN